MIILSQDRKQIVNFNNVTGITIIEILDEINNPEREKEFLIGADTNGNESNCFELGSYRTEGRAKEVFENILDVLAAPNTTGIGKEYATSEKIYVMPE